MVANTTLQANANDVTLTVDDRNLAYFIQMAALNQVGQGPFSTPLEVEFDPTVLLIPSKGNTQQNELFTQGNTKQVTLIIGVISAALFVLILISAVICYKKKLHGERKPMGYLAASTADDFHCQLNRHSGPIIKGSADISAEKRHSKDASLWIDRRWGSDSCEKDSNSSEKKLLNLHSSSHHTHSNSNSDTEYAYVENKHNVSSFTNSSGSRKTAESPEPYATTELFQKQAQQTHYAAQQLHPPHSQHYAAPMIVPPNHYRRNVHSCDDLTESAESQHVRAQQMTQQHYLMPHNYQRASTGGNKMKQRGKPKNLLDMIPPPPLHPPPPPTNIYNKSQESVISPKYLFAHPMYQGTSQRPQIYGHAHKIHPNNNRSHYEQIEPLIGNHNPQQRLMFDRDCHDELQHFNSILTQFGQQSVLQHHHQRQSSQSKSQSQSRSSTVKSAASADQFSLHCEADNEDEEDQLE